MYAPQGFKPFEAIYEDLCDLVFEDAFARRDEFEKDGREHSVPGKGQHYITALNLGAAVNLITTPKAIVRICASDGTVINPVWHLWACQPRFRSYGAPLPQNDIESIRNFLLPLAYGYFCFINSDLWVVSVPDLRGLSDKWDKDCSLRKASKIFSVFQDWSLCVSEDFDVEEWYQAVREQTFPTERKRSGRPPLIPDVARVLTNEFGEGRGDLSWKQLAREVGQRLGRPVGDRTVQRAMQQIHGDGPTK